METTNEYNHQSIEAKWRKRWLEDKTYSVDLKNAKKPFYNLMMFPYPSAEGLHVGNMYAFTGADVYGRYQRMKGYDVFEPIGLDGFGIHSENYAIKIGKHPAEQAKISEAHFYDQLKMIGNGFSWDNHLETYDPEYYKWTQWLFIKMFEHGLAYRKKARVNWCPSCKTVLADEQVEGGKCERCKNETTYKDLEQWFFKITDYAEKLLAGIDQIKWPEKIKTAQRQWIGKAKGLNIRFMIHDLRFKKKSITVWTKFWETVFGTTYLVIAPEYPLVAEILTVVGEDKRREIEAYIKMAKSKTEQQRKANEKDKTGVDTGIMVVNPVNGKSVPLWIADYVLTDVGTGAVMGVPAHDERDFDFAKKYNLPIIQVVSYEDKEIDGKVARGEMAYEGEGKLTNSGQFDSLDAWGEGKTKMAEWMIQEGISEWLITYHLRDWLISRQRYWGPPIPMVECKQCGWQPVPEEQLPVKLPDLTDFKPKGDGGAPLDNASQDWLYTTCPKCGGKARRETNVSDTFLDSAWYFLRYPREKGEGISERGVLPWDDEIIKKWLPVNAYIGGAEHAVLHLLYSRFVWKALIDWGLLKMESKQYEPFPFLYGHGLIIKDGAKMSKSRGNIVNPDEYIDKFGADALRMYLMFIGPYDQGGDFKDAGMVGMQRFLKRVWLKYQMIDESRDKIQETSAELKSKLQETIAKVDRDLGAFRYNTAIAAMMEWFNAWGESQQLSMSDAKKVLKLMAPLAPYITEEIWEKMGENGSIHKQEFPKVDEALILDKPLTVMVMVNGRMRQTLQIQDLGNMNQESIEMMARGDEKVKKWLVGKEIRKKVFVAPTTKKQGILSIVVS